MARKTPRWGLVAACAVLTIEALGLLGGGSYLAYRSTGDSATDHRAAVTQAVFALLAGLVFGVLARGARPSHPAIAVRTPATILQVIFIPVSIGLFQSGRSEIGAPLLLSALVGIAGLLTGFRSRNDGT